MKLLEISEIPFIEQSLTGNAVFVIDETTASGLAETFQALADPTRLRIISALMGGDRCVNDLAGLLAMTQSAISHQLRILRNLHLVKYCKDGRTVYYALDDDHIRDLYQRGFDHYQHQFPMVTRSEEDLE